MSLGELSTKNENLSQGTGTDIDRRVLVIGAGNLNKSQLIQFNQDTDFTTLLGAGNLLDQVQALADNAVAGGSYFGGAYPLEVAETWQDGLDACFAAGFQPELIVLTDVPADKAAIEAIQTKANELEAQGVFVMFMTALQGIDDATETWSQYQTNLNTIITDIVAENVVLVPQLHGNNLGVLAGRLVRADVSIADSPMRTKTGPVSSLGAIPKDSNDLPYGNAQGVGLDGIRLSVPQSYKGQQGTYWADANTLDKTGGDYPNTDVLRPVLKAMRLVHQRMFPRIADRSINQSKASVIAAESYAAKPLRDMAKGTRRGDEDIPGDIAKPDDGDVAISWKSSNEIEVAVAVKTVKSPKKIVNKIYVKAEG